MVSPPPTDPLSELPGFQALVFAQPHRVHFLAPMGMDFWHSGQDSGSGLYANSVNPITNMTIAATA